MRPNGLFGVIIIQPALITYIYTLCYAKNNSPLPVTVRSKILPLPIANLPSLASNPTTAEAVRTCILKRGSWDSTSCPSQALKVHVGIDRDLEYTLKFLRVSPYAEISKGDATSGQAMCLVYEPPKCGCELCSTPACESSVLMRIAFAKGAKTW